MLLRKSSAGDGMGAWTQIAIGGNEVRVGEIADDVGVEMVHFEVVLSTPTVVSKGARFVARSIASVPTTPIRIAVTTSATLLRLMFRSLVQSLAPELEALPG